jgi:tRNA threonylcarbamoyl adenosine modification protein YeaZ
VLVLALDTATAATAVALVSFDDGGDLTGGDCPPGLAAQSRLPGLATAQQAHVDPRAHGEQLAPMIQAVLAAGGARPDQLDAIVAGTGPGPFTGLRVGLVTAAAMGQALAIPTYGVCSLDGIGVAADAEPTLVATDARRREIYWAIYDGGRRLTEPAVGRPGDIVPLLAVRGVHRALGEGARRYRAVLGLPVADEPTYPAPTALATAAYHRIAAGVPGEQLAARYLRRPDVSAPRPPKRVSR